MSDEMRGAPRPSCPRTKGFIERIARDAVTPADREHAAGCASCGPVLATAARFDDALRRSARGLVDEPLPDGIFDPAILPHRPGAAGRRALPDRRHHRRRRDPPHGVVARDPAERPERHRRTQRLPRQQPDARRADEHGARHAGDDLPLDR